MDKRKLEIKISLETGAKFQARFFLILLALEIGLSSEGKFSEITSLAPPQAQIDLAQSTRAAEAPSQAITGSRGPPPSPLHPVQGGEAWGQTEPDWQNAEIWGAEGGFHLKYNLTLMFSSVQLLNCVRLFATP